MKSKCINILAIVLLSSITNQAHAAQRETRAQQTLKRKFFEAIHDGDCAQVKKCIKSGMDVNRIYIDAIERDPYEKTTPLEYAVRKNQLKITRELLKAGTSPNEKTEKTPLLMKAIRIHCYGKQDASIALALIKAGADVNVTHQNCSSLTEAACCENKGLARALVKAGAEWEGYGYYDASSDAWIKKNLKRNFINYRKKVVKEVDKHLLPELANIVAEYVTGTKKNVAPWEIEPEQVAVPNLEQGIDNQMVQN